MRDWDASKKRYLQDEISIRLGNLASNLARIKSQCQHSEHQQLVADVLYESKLFIEWTAVDAEIDVAAELVELQIQLALWQNNWETIWENSEQRMKVSEQAKVWSDRILDLSGLLEMS